MNSSNIGGGTILKKVDKILLFTSILLFIIGLIMIFSSSNVASYMKFDKAPYAFFLRQSIFLIFSFILALVIIRFPIKSYSYISWIGIIVIIVS